MTFMKGRVDGIMGNGWTNAKTQKQVDELSKTHLN